MNGFNNYPSGTITVASQLQTSGYIGWSVRGQAYDGSNGPYVASGTVNHNGGQETTPVLSGWPLWQVFFSPAGEPNNLMAADGVSFANGEDLEITIVQTQAPE